MHENLLQATLQVNTSICSISLAIMTVSEEGREGERERENNYKAWIYIVAVPAKPREIGINMSYL